MAYKLTVRDALQLPALSGCLTLSGKAGLDREIRTVMVGDTLDVADWVSENDFVISTVPFMNKDKANDALLCQWARSILERKPCALGIKTMRLADQITDPQRKCAATVRTRRYIERMPASLLTLGDEYGIPILSLPAFAAQNEISRDIMWAIIDQYEKVRKHTLEAFLDISTLMVHDHTLGEVAARLEHYVGNPILIENDQLALLAISTIHPPGSSAAEAIRLRRSSEFLASVRAALPMEQGDCVALELMLQDGSTVRSETFPVIAHGHVLGFVSTADIFSPITDDMRDLLRTLIGAVAMDMARQAYLEISAWQMRSQLLEQLLAPQFDERSCEYLCGLLGFDTRREKAAMIFGVRRSEQPTDPEGPYDTYYLRLLVRSITEYLKARRIWSFVCEYKGVVVLFVNASPSRDLKALAVSLHEHLIHSAPEGDAVSVGIGRSGVGLSACRSSCMEAQDAVMYLRDFAPDQSVASYQELGLHALLVALLRNRDAAVNYCRSILGTLIAHDRREGSELLETLRVYLACNGSLVETGKALFLHPKTVKYRMGQISGMLPFPLTDFNNRSTVWLALNIYQSLSELC